MKRRMHIAYISADRGIPLYGPKGASIHIRELIKAFAQLGHKVTVLTSRRGNVSTSLPAEILKVNTPHPVIDKFNHSDEKTKLREEHAMANSRALIRATQTLHSKNPVDLIYERYSLFSDCGLQVSKILNKPLILEVNSPLIAEQQRYRKIINIEQAKQIESCLFSKADRIAAVSDEVAEYAITVGASKRQILVLANGVDTEHFHPKVPVNADYLQHNRFTIGFVGSLKAWHGIECLMKAFQKLSLIRDDCRLLIAGDGPLRSWMEGFTSGAGLESRVCITGWVDHGTLPGVMGAMDIAVAPYPELSDFYFSPLKLFEYMAMGLPVIASRSGQIKQVIEPSENGVLVNPGDADELVTALLKLINEPKICRLMGRKAREYACHHTWRNNAQQLVNSVFQDTSSTAVNY